VLLDCKNELFQNVLEELRALGATDLCFLDNCVKREQPCLIYFLWLYKGVYPVLLASLKLLDKVLLRSQLLLVLGKVLRADVFDLFKLLIVLLL